MVGINTAGSGAPSDPADSRRLFLYFLYKVLRFENEFRELQPDFVRWLPEARSRTQRPYPPELQESLITKNRATITRELVQAGLVREAREGFLLTEHGLRILRNFKIEIPAKEIVEAVRTYNLSGTEMVLALAVCIPGVSSGEINAALRVQTAGAYSTRLVSAERIILFHFGGPQRTTILLPTKSGAEYYDERLSQIP